MNKQISNEEITELLKTMNEDEMRELVASLNAYKSKISKKESIKTGNRLFEMNGTRYKKRCTLTFENSDGEKGKIMLVGASFPYLRGFEVYKDEIKPVPQYWWLLYNTLVYKNQEVYKDPERWDIPRVGHIRPTLVLDIEDKSGLKRGDVFTINGCEYQMINDSVAIKSDCLSGNCTYDESIMNYILKGWFDEVVEKNKKMK